MCFEGMSNPDSQNRGSRKENKQKKKKETRIRIHSSDEGSRACVDARHFDPPPHGRGAEQRFRQGALQLSALSQQTWKWTGAFPKRKSSNTLPSVSMIVGRASDCSLLSPMFSHTRPGPGGSALKNHLERSFAEVWLNGPRALASFLQLQASRRRSPARL